MSPQGGSFPYSAWMKEGMETRTERVKRLERERVLVEIEKRVGDPWSLKRGEWDEILKELREGEE